MDLTKLSNEELATLFRRDGNKLAFDIMCELNMKLVYYMTRSFTKSFIYLKDDIEGYGFIGLVKAARAFKPEKNNKFATFAVPVIRNEILMFLRREKLISTVKKEGVTVKPKGAAISLHTEVPGTDETLTIEDMLVDPESGVDRWIDDESFDFLWAYVSTVLKRFELNMFIELNGAMEDPATQKKYADKIGVSRSYVSRLQKNLMTSLRYRLYHIDKLRESYHLPESWGIVEEGFDHDIERILSAPREKPEEMVVKVQPKLTKEDLTENYHLSITALRERYACTLDEINEAAMQFGMKTYFENKGLISVADADILLSDGGNLRVTDMVSAGVAVRIINDERYVGERDIWGYIWKNRSKIVIENIRYDFPYKDSDYVKLLRKRKQK